MFLGVEYSSILRTLQKQVAMGKPIASIVAFRVCT